MKRREFGINLDDGVALSTEQEFGLLYVPCNPDEAVHLQEWFAGNAQEPLLLGGQIGSGKTTLLTGVSHSLIDTQPIIICFDTEPIEPSEGGYSMLLFGRVVQACLKAGVKVDDSGIELSDFPSLAVDSWPAFADKATTWPSNLKEASLLREACAVMTEYAEPVREACGSLLNRLRNFVSYEPTIIAEGIDKFQINTPEYFSLKDTLTFLAKWKTLFEVNAVHLFQEQAFPPGIRKLFIGGIGEDMLAQMFGKRLGSYAPVYQEAFPLIAYYSGGNARQALRLLSAYYLQRTQHQNDHAAAIAMACHQVAKDLLNIPSGHFPAEIFTVVKRDKYIEGSLFTDRNTAREATDAIYYNWMLVQDEPAPTTPTQWPVIINPLIDEAIEWETDAPRTREEEAVRKWACDHDISPLGLNLPVDANGNPTWDKFWEEIEASVFSDKDELNILGVLKEIAAGFFGLERQDRIIITYLERGNLEATRDFLVGEANTYSHFPCEEIILVGGEDQEPVVELLVRLTNRDPNHIYSVELTGEWTEAQLCNLDHRRDILANLQMLWWIQRDDLKHYLRYWPQLRQFFRIYSLEDELWRGITLEEIQEDIDFINDMSDESEPEGVRRLSAVLSYLKELGGES